MLVRPVDVGLLARELRVAHRANLAPAAQAQPPPCRTRSGSRRPGSGSGSASAAVPRRTASSRGEPSRVPRARRGSAVALRAALTAPRPSALVTCDAEARLAVVDLGSFRVLRSIRRSPDPRAIELVGDRAVVCHTAVGAVSIVDRHGVRHVCAGSSSRATRPRIRTGGTRSSPTPGRSGVVALDVARGRVLGRVKLPGWARHLTIDRAGSRLWVALGSASPSMSPSSTSTRCGTSATLTPGFGRTTSGSHPTGGSG